MDMARRRSFGDISYGFVIGGLAALAVLVIVTPVVVVLMTSFTEGRSLKFPPTGFSFGWYAQLFDPSQSRQIHRAALNSLEVACFSTLFGVVLATLASLGLARDRRKMARLADNVFMSPLVLPGITFGLAALVYFSTLGFRPSLDLLPGRDVDGPLTDLDATQSAQGLHDARVAEGQARQVRLTEPRPNRLGKRAGPHRDRLGSDDQFTLNDGNAKVGRAVKVTPAELREPQVLERKGESRPDGLPVDLGADRHSHLNRRVRHDLVHGETRDRVICVDDVGHLHVTRID